MEWKCLNPDFWVFGWKNKSKPWLAEVYANSKEDNWVWIVHHFDSSERGFAASRELAVSKVQNVLNVQV